MGVDLGATLAKIVFRDSSGQLHFDCLPAAEMDRLKQRIASLKPEKVGLTGGGASRLAELLDIPCQRQDEFSSWGAGARRLDTGTPPIMEAYVARAGMAWLREIGLA